MYHLTVGGQQVTNLRLSPKTIMDIFTGAVTNWDAPEITHDYGQQLPNIPITPVVRTDGSGATFFFTRWMAHVFPTEWNAFCTKVTSGRVKPPCPETEFYPTNGPGWNAKGENGSTAVADYITSSYANGAIGYDEYAYAINSHYPVVQVLNPAGYYVLPSASNVAVALTQAVINEDASSPDFLQQNLDSVYTYKDPRSYPVSSYSYLIAPRQGSKIPPRFNNGKGATLSTFANYILCAGQQNLAQLGYSPLPLNLVTGGLLQSGHIPGHVPEPSLNKPGQCDNPTFTNGVLTLLKDAAAAVAVRQAGRTAELRGRRRQGHHARCGQQQRRAIAVTRAFEGANHRSHPRDRRQPRRPRRHRNHGHDADPPRGQSRWRRYSGGRPGHGRERVERVTRRARPS